MRRGSRRLILWFVLLTVILGACSADDAATFSEVALSLDGAATVRANQANGEAPEVEDAVDEASGESANLGKGAVVPVAFQTTNFGRDIIFTAAMTVAVPDVGAANEEATRIIARLGGFLFGQQSTGSPDPYSTLTFKIDPESFHQALNELGSIGDVRTQNVSANDVTDRIVDLESQIATSAASVQRLRSLLEEATDIKEVVALEGELVARETQLESLRGQHRTLQDQVALATIVVTITEAASNPELQMVVTAYPGHDEGTGCPGEFEGVGIDQDTSATVCFEVTNVGDTLLTDFDFRDPVLDLDTEDLIVVFGDLNGSLEPGDSIVLAAEITVERDLRTQTTVTAVPVNEDGSPISGPPASRTSTFFIDAVDPGGIATFSEGLEASWNWLISLGQVLLLLAGALLPFFWVPLLGWIAWRMLRRSKDSALVTEES